MKRLEEELGKAFKRVEPPAGFAERVMARAAASEQTKARTAWTWLGFVHAGGLRWAVAGALCLALGAGGILYQLEQQRRAQGEEAKQQLMLALRITANELQTAQAEVRGISSTN
jgi:uncharacterized protein HemX